MKGPSAGSGDGVRMVAAVAESLSRGAFAKLINRDEKVVRKLIARGLLPVDEHNRLPMPAAMDAYALVNPTNAAQPAPAPVPARVESSVTAPVPAKHNEALELDLTKKSLGVKLQELRIGRESGELVRRADVRREAERVCGAIRSALLAMPARVSLLLEGVIASADGEVRAAQIRRLLEREIDQALEALYEHRTAPDSAGDAA
jgi:hypothetical protein